ncbi:hypothetical protein BT93_H3923 [Corymbia citriodora subsp. variegata]|nr:hypothetical protein BT93_H3923 [Corymbia citriodora subsp. variegata]
MRKRREQMTTPFSKLPDELISQIISLLPTPQDACRASAVSTSFRSIADSDQVWLKFLPLDHSDVILPQISPMKSLYLHLCDHGVPVGGNRNTIFSLDKKSRKKCFLIGARELGILWGDNENYWTRIVEPNSRFDQVAQLLVVWWFHIERRIDTKILSPKTRSSKSKVTGVASNLLDAVCHYGECEHGMSPQAVLQA